MLQHSQIACAHYVTQIIQCTNTLAEVAAEARQPSATVNVHSCNQGLSAQSTSTKAARQCTSTNHSCITHISHRKQFQRIADQAGNMLMT